MKRSGYPPTTAAAQFATAAIALFLLTSATGASAQRLPSTVVPQHYVLSLTPDLKNATFSGVESIDVLLKDSTDTITLNSAEIAFQTVTIRDQAGQQSATISLDDEKQQATFRFPRALPAGKATLAIRYTGLLNNELRGFYLSKTARRNYAVTQFESTDARRAFPSFDEPALKATFDVSLVIDTGDTAISNTAIESDTPGPSPEKHTLRFSTTPKMSTYLLAFLVGDFQCTSGEQDGVTIRSCATPDKVALTPYSVEAAKFFLHYYNNYFGIPYPLKKLDLIALPDFEAGAMENFGAITYRETTLLLDEKTASLAARQVVAVDIAHEMAHQWFGDLVTMQWWDNVWLNEGFATWMESKAVGVMYPEWHMEEVVAVDLDKTLNIDAQPTTRPIRARADTPDEINQMFDGIAYNKAGHVLDSVENFVGPEVFRQGVHNYLAAHLYANATAEDFWNAEAAVSHKPVDRIMESLVAQPGVPALTFSEPAHGKVSATQSRFFLSPSITANTVHPWVLPVCLKTASQGQQCDVLSPENTSLRVPPGSLFFADAGGRGYYRSLYPPSVYQSLVAHAESGLTPTERIGLIGDAWARLRDDKSSAGDYLDLVAAVKDDPSAAVVGTAVDGVGTLYDRVASSPEEKSALSAWIRRTFEPRYQALDTPSPQETPNQRELRAQIFLVLGFYGKDPAILARAHQLAEQYLADPSSVDPTLRESALSVAASNGDENLYDQLLHVYETSSSPELQIDALRRLAVFQDPKLVQRALQMAVSGKVRNQDAVFQLAIEMAVNENRQEAWEFIQSHWDKVQAQFTENMGAALVDSTDAFCSATDRDNVRQFFATHKVTASDVSLRHALEHINGCIELRALQEPALRSWLSARPGDGGAQHPALR
ncbi:MAG TPA: M1 family metallopeptidase [Terracidiphilus sp.]|jgi:aminopeptidase N/puromycin-sensitive aminopeptidase|nr:M1 family metallopeptidase [Terracidiphilus sp.]